MLDRTVPPLLVVDDDRKFLETIQVEASARAAGLVVATSAVAARLSLLAQPRGFSGIFINPGISGTGALRVVRTVIERHAGTPLYFICDNGVAPSVPTEELERITVQGAFQKPLTFAQMLEIASPVAATFELAPEVAAAFNTPDPEGTELSADGVELVPIRAANYIGGKRSFFDLYVKGAPGRFFKVVKAGDPFDAERLLGYLRKGVIWLYLRKEARQAYLDYCDHLAKGLIVAPRASPALKLVGTAAYGDETLRFLREQGVGDESLRHARAFVDRVRELVLQAEWSSDPILDKFLSDVVLYEHGVSTALVVVLLFEPLGIEAERLQRMIALAALLHDIGVCCLPDGLQRKDEAAMSFEELQLYESHTKLGAELLRDVTGIDHFVLQGIHQHHERRDGSGYPRGDGPGMISRVAELIGIADELVRVLAAAGIDPSIRVFREMEQRVFDGFSAEVVNALCVTLFPRVKAARLP